MAHGPFVHYQPEEKQFKENGFSSSSLDIKTLHQGSKLVLLSKAIPKFLALTTLTFSPVVKHYSLRIVLAIAAAKDLEMIQLDIKTAFLYGDLQEEIYMEQP
jgi:hypothetical protein